MWATLKKQLKQDSQFLAKNRVMDYSLLVGVRQQKLSFFSVVLTMHM